MQRDLEAGGLVGLRLGVGEAWSTGRRRTSSARTASRRPSIRPGCRPRRRSNCPAVPPLPWSSPVSTTAAFPPRGRYQKRGSGVRSRFICVMRLASRRCCSSACGIATLLRSQPVGRRTGRRSGSRLGLAVALLAGPGEVALARVDDRAREVVGEGGGLAAGRADAAQGDGGVARSRWRRRSTASPPRGAPAERVGSAVPWNCIVSAVMPAPGAERRRDPQVAVGQLAGVGAQAEQAGEPRVGPHRDEVAAVVHPVGQQRRLGVGQRGLRPSSTT